MSRDRLIEELWDGRPPATAVSTLHAHLSKLRAALGGLLVLEPAGYSLILEGSELDVWRFDRLIEQARAVDPERARSLLIEALALCRGEPLCDVEGDGMIARWRRLLEEKQLDATLSRIDADLEVREARELIGELTGLVGEHPFEERVWGQLMLALYRAGRQADALDAYGRIRARLAEDLGLDPGPRLRSLQQQILEQAPSLTGGEPTGGGRRVSTGPSTVTHDLPALATATIGREDALEEVLSLLGRQEVRVLTLVGPGGVGKTRLALLAAHTVAPSFADGVCWVELAGVASPDQVASTIVRALEITPAGSETGEQSLVRYLAAKQILIVLDNFEHVIDSASLVAEMHRTCPDLTVVVTSREALDLAAEHRYTLAPLRLPGLNAEQTVDDVEATPSTAMFLAAARRRDHRFSVAQDDVDALVRICTRLEGLPLALELAASRTGAIGLGLLADDLEAELENLGAGPRDAPARQRTLQATIEWSLRLLDPAVRTVCVRFSVFAGGGTPEAARKVTGARPDQIESLVAKSLIDRRMSPGGGTRLVMLDTVRHYAQRLLAADPGEGELRRRHFEHYLGVAEQAEAQVGTRDERRAVSTLDREIENLHAARDWSLAHDPATCLRLVGQHGLYLAMRLDPIVLAWIEAALQAAGDSASANDIAVAHYRRSRILSSWNMPRPALEAARTALPLFRDAGNDAGIALALVSIGYDTAQLDGDIEKERRSAKIAVRHAEASGDERVCALALSELAEASTGEDRAPAVERAALALLRTGDDRGLARLYANAAYAALTEDRGDEAIELLSRAAAATERTGSPVANLKIFGNLGLARLFSGEPAAAREAFAQQLALCHELGLRADEAESLAGLAAIAAIEGHDEVAARLRGAATGAGYPSGEYDRQIDQRMVRAYLEPARRRLGQATWRHAEAAGAAWTQEEATAHALEWANAIAIERPQLASRS